MKLLFSAGRDLNGRGRSLISTTFKTLLVLLAALPQMSFTGYSQHITLNKKNVPLEDVLLTIEKKTDYVFFYDNSDLASRAVSVYVKNSSIETALEACFKDQPLEFKIVDKNVVVSKVKAPLVAVPAMVQAAPLIDTIGGVVRDDMGFPLEGVTVQIKGTERGTVTDEDGRYLLRNIPEGTTLVFSMIGFELREMPVSAVRAGVVLQQDASKLSEIVVVGYGTKLRSNITGAVSSVNSEVLENRPINNLSQGLQGVIPNLNVAVGSGTPGTSASLNIRGYASINGDGAPLVLVDGVQMDIDAVNPSDVESISVLKDAASAAIYGARAAFGVVLITTKAGRYGEKAKVTYANNFQHRKPTVIPDLMNSVDFVEAANTASRNFDNTVAYPTDRVQWITDYFNDPQNAPIYHDLPNGTFFWNANGNGFDEVVRDWSPTMRHDLTFTGGSAKTSMYASLGYMDQQGMFKVGNDKFKRYTATIKARTKVIDALSIGFQSVFTKSNYDEPFEYGGKGSYWHAIMRDNPFMPQYTPDYAPVGGGLLTGRYVNYLESGARNVTDNLTSLLKLDLDYRIVKGLHFKTDLSYQNRNTGNKTNRLLVERYQNDWSSPQTTHSLPTFTKRSNKQTDYMAFNMYADYSLNINTRHRFNLLGGFNQEYSKTTDFSAQVNDLLNETIPTFSTASGEDNVTDEESEWAIRGLFTRFNYNYDNKYLVEFSGRYDGTSRFPSHSRFAFFPSVSAGWRISEENFMQDVSWLDNLMLRASYGSLGNQNVENYAYISSLRYQPQVGYVFANQRPAGILPPPLVSADLTWETVTSSNFGLDINLFRKLRVSGSYYTRRTDDMLTSPEKLPATLGVDPPRQNSASLETKGWELEIGWNNKVNNELNYDVTLVLSDSRARISKFDRNPNGLIAENYVGKEIGEIWGYVTEGIIQSVEQAEKMPPQNKLGNVNRWGPGDVKYRDLNGDGEVNFGSNRVNDAGDRTIIGNSRARYNFGLRLGLNWKGFDMSMFIQGIGKQHYVPGDMIYWGYERCRHWYTHLLRI